MKPCLSFCTFSYMQSQIKVQACRKVMSARLQYAIRSLESMWPGLPGYLGIAKKPLRFLPVILVPLV